LLRLFLSIEILKFLVPFFEIPRHMLSQLRNETLRQSEDAADAIPTNDAIPNIQASIVDKSLFIFYKEKE
jgi:hypothetical protein